MKVHSVCQINHRGEPQATCSHLTRKLPASWHLVGFKWQRINPSRLLEIIFDLEGNMECVISSTAPLSFVLWKNYSYVWYTFLACLLKLFSPCCGQEVSILFHYTRQSTIPSLSFSSFYSLPLSSPLSSLFSHSFPFSYNRATGAGGLEITCAVLCFRPDTVINHCPSHTSTYNNKDWLLCGGCCPIAFHCADAKLEVNGHSQTLLPCPLTVSSFRYLSISAQSVELLPTLPRGPRLLEGGSDLLLRLFGFDSVPIS